MFSPLEGPGRYNVDCLEPSWLEKPMFVPEEIRQSVVFLGNKDALTGRFHPRGTGFIVSIHENKIGFRYLVTADHNIAAFAKRGWDIYLRSNTKEGGAREDNWGPAHWYFHPDVGTTDVAITPIDFHPEEEFKTILLGSDDPNSPGDLAGTREILAQRELGIGEEVVTVGLFRSHSGRQRNVPIVRIGNLAMMRGEPVPTQHCGYTDAYLIEARSISGLSGSPVFIRAPLFQVKNGTVVGSKGPQFYLLGLMHGHFDVKNLKDDIVLDSADDSEPRGVNTGIGVVIPVEKILETIYQPELVEMRKKAAKEHIEKHGATADFADAPAARDANPAHREDFNRLLGAAVQNKPKD